MFKGNLIATARPKTLASSAQEHVLFAGTRFKRQGVVYSYVGRQRSISHERLLAIL